MTSSTYTPPKYHQAHLCILKFICEHNLHIGDALPTERELVKHLPCSSITMRHALADMEKLGMLIRQRSKGTFLAKEINSIDFQFNLLFLYVTHKERTENGVGVDQLRLYLAEHGIGLNYMTTTDFNQEIIHAAQHCLGIIAHGWLTDSFITELKGLNLPLVAVGNTNLRVDVPTLSLDLVQGARHLTEIVLSRGCRHIALFRGKESYYPAIQYQEGYLQTLSQTSQQPLILNLEAYPSFSQAIEDFMKTHPETDGVLMEHSALGDFMSWFWGNDFPRKPVLGILSTPDYDRLFQQRDNFIWTHHISLFKSAGEMLLNYILEGSPLHSQTIPVTIPGINTQKGIFHI